MRTITINPTNAPEDFVPSELEILEEILPALHDREQEVLELAREARRNRDYARCNILRAAAALAQDEYFRLARRASELHSKRRSNGL